MNILLTILLHIMNL